MGSEQRLAEIEELENAYRLRMKAVDAVRRLGPPYSGLVTVLLYRVDRDRIGVQMIWSSKQAAEKCRRGATEAIAKVLRAHPCQQDRRSELKE